MMILIVIIIIIIIIILIIITNFLLDLGGENLTKQLPSNIINHMRSQGLVVEVTSTVSAASTFNILNQEGRNVAAAILTCQPYDVKEAIDVSELKEK